MAGCSSHFYHIKGHWVIQISIWRRYYWCNWIPLTGIIVILLGRSLKAAVKSVLTVPAWCHVPAILAPLPWGSSSTAEPFQVWLFLSTSDAPRASQWSWKPDGARGEDWYLWRWSHSVTLIFTFARAHFIHFKLKTKYIFPARDRQLLYTHSPRYRCVVCTA